MWEFPESIRFNDGSVSPTGEIYVGTMSMDRRLDDASLFHFDLRTRALATVLSGVGISNGMAWRDDTHAFYVDSLTSRVDLLDFSDPSSVRRQPWHSFETGTEPDGLAIDSSGTVHVAMWGDGQVRRLRPDGLEIDPWNVEEALTTSVAFGGGQQALALITTAGNAEPTDQATAEGSVYLWEP